MVNEELEKFLSERHKDVTLFDFEGKKVPCIIVDEKKFDNLMKTIAGKPVSVETNLNILQDGLGHVFVRVTLEFSQGGIEEKFLIYANEAMLISLKHWQKQRYLLFLLLILTMETLMYL